MLIYRILSIILYPIIELYIFYRAFQKKEDKHRVMERFGRSSVERPQGDLIWLNAVSVGEANSALILVEELLKNSPETSLLFTTTTLTSAAVIGSKLSTFEGRVIHQFSPIDSYFCVKNFLNFWQPSKSIFVESEIWPNLIAESRKIMGGTFLVNARISEKSIKKWKIAYLFQFKIFNYFTAIFAQTVEDQKRLQQLTKNKVLFFGNLKSQAQNLPFKAEELEKLKAQIGSRKIWLAASTHKGEEEFVVKAHHQLKKDFPDLLTILVPRHPNRAEEIKALLSGINVAQRSKGETISDSTDFYLSDTLGELGIFYRLANFTFIGGSIFEIGGHNPFEAIKLNCTVISSGRGVFNFKEIYEKLDAAKACVIIDSGDEIGAAVKNFLENPEACKVMNEKALELISTSENFAGNIAAKMKEFS
jgi:3-deoxy-D-manno-octulosonic-acid transferase